MAEEHVALRNVISTLSRACAKHGHFDDLHAALVAADPQLAQEHLASVGNEINTSGVILSMEVDDQSYPSNVLDSYLFGESRAMLKRVSMMCDLFTRISSKSVPRAS